VERGDKRDRMGGVREMRDRMGEEREMRDRWVKRERCWI